MKSNKEIKTYKILEKKTGIKDIKVLKKIDENIFVCKLNDHACWQRYSLAMGDCI
jgi:hypothetical protein